MLVERSVPYTFEPRLLATTLGSLPHRDVERATALILEYTPELPAWVQFPALGESMMRQFNDGLPGLVTRGGSQYVDTRGPAFEEALTDFYTLYLSISEELEEEALDSFALPAEAARGFYELLHQLPMYDERLVAVKGQVVGPFTLGMNLTDQDYRALYYDERLRDVIVKLVGLKARWQIRRLRELWPRVIIFLDEPSLLGYGNATTISVGRDDLIRDLNEVVATIHEEGGLAGVHCEENTDWSLLMDSSLDILDFDAYGHFQSIALYPDALRSFLRRGGSLGWGLVPTLDRQAAAVATVEDLVERFEGGLDHLERRGVDRELLVRRALITPSCGAGTLTERLAERVLIVLRDLSLTLQARYGF